MDIISKLLNNLYCLSISHVHKIDQWCCQFMVDHMALQILPLHCSGIIFFNLQIHFVENGLCNINAKLPRFRRLWQIVFVKSSKKYWSNRYGYNNLIVKKSFIIKTIHQQKESSCIWRQLWRILWRNSWLKIFPIFCISHYIKRSIINSQSIILH